MNRMINPAPGKVLLKKCKKQEKKGSLIIPDQAEKGTPIYVIENINLTEDYWMIDDMVILSNNYPIWLEIDDQVFYMVDSKDILGTVSWK